MLVDIQVMDSKGVFLNVDDIIFDKCGANCRTLKIIVKVKESKK